ncbi:MAG: M23 family metallopeptidase, partial [Dokdonella sp.]
KSDGSGVDEPAVDILVNESRLAVSVGPGWVVMAVPRHIPVFSPAGNDPYQREVFVRHRIGTGRYAELFTTYYAHMQDTAVRRGGNVSAGTVLGQVGETGAASGQHLHLSVHRNKNLSWRKDFEFHFAGGSWDRDGRVSAVDPWGWSAPQGPDPWAWRFRSVYSNHPELDDAGSFSSLMWLNGENPTLF